MIGFSCRVLASVFLLTGHLSSLAFAMGLDRDQCESSLEGNLVQTFAQTFSVSELLESPLPEKIHPSKAHFFARILQSERETEWGELEFQKFQLRGGRGIEWVLDQPIAQASEVTVAESVFDYAQGDEHDLHVYLNFADSNLFSYWNSGLFAQDEIQVMEHPALAFLRMSVLQNQPGGMVLNTWQNEVALVSHVPRMAAVNARGIYGNAFAQAPLEILEQKIVPLVQPQRTHILAMAALPVGRELEGKAYDLSRLRYHLVTATTGFSAARTLASGQQRVNVHTGNWGTGAFGNNARVIAMLQILAARIAGVDNLVYHTVSPDMTEQMSQGQKWLEQMASELGPEASARDFLREILKMNLPYGQGNGT